MVPLLLAYHHGKLLTMTPKRFGVQDSGTRWSNPRGICSSLVFGHRFVTLHTCTRVPGTSQDSSHQLVELLCPKSYAFEKAEIHKISNGKGIAPGLMI
jgi:hypothetical protein